MYSENKLFRGEKPLITLLTEEMVPAINITIYCLPTQKLDTSIIDPTVVPTHKHFPKNIQISFKIVTNYLKPTSKIMRTMA